MTPTQEISVTRADLDKYGIVTVPQEAFLWDGYRYTNARDALAAAKRAISQ